MSAESKQTVLLVGDDADIRESLRNLLQFDGYKVKTARDGQHALEQLRDGARPCIILLDLVMSGVAGEHFRAEQLQDPEFADIPVVALSGEYDSRQDAAAVGAGADIHLPPDIVKVLKLVEVHCVRQNESAAKRVVVLRGKGQVTQQVID